MRLLKAAEGARPMLLGFDSNEAAGACVAAIIGAGIIPVALEFMDRPAIHVCEHFVAAGYPLDVEALLIVEVRAPRTRSTRCWRRSPRSPATSTPTMRARSQSAEESAKIWKGRKAAFGAIGQLSDYYLHGRRDPAVQAAQGAGRDRLDLPRATASTSPTSSMPATAICIR